MAIKIIWSPTAVADLQAIVDYISRDSANYAASMAERIVSSIESTLPRFPRAGRIVPELNKRDVRELIVGKYRILYRVRAKSVDIASIIHGARSLQKAIRGRRI